MSKLTGQIHSIQTLGALDGPGLRTVVFFQGCPLQCKFCHSIDTTIVGGKAHEYEVDELLAKLLKNREYWGDSNGNIIRGGVTLSGGDPMLQPNFTFALLKELRKHGVHTAVETSLFCDPEVIGVLAPYVNLWIVSVKHVYEDKHKFLTGRSGLKILSNLEYLNTKCLDIGSQVRIRFVLIPGVTDSEEVVTQVGRIAGKIASLEAVELLPYTTLGVFKWLSQFGKYELSSIRDALPEDVERCKAYIRAVSVPVL